MTATTTWPTTADGKWLVLRTVDADWRSRDGFRWYKTVETVAPDWDPDPGRECGGGLMERMKALNAIHKSFAMWRGARGAEIHNLPAWVGQNIAYLLDIGIGVGLDG